MELSEGETVLFQAHLNSNRWMCYRCTNCSVSCFSTLIGTVLIPIYAICGIPCRQAEANSFELTLTNRNIHFTQKIYSWGMCCQTTQNKIIPLEKIQDIALVSDCCGDTCGFVDRPGDVYQLHFQTAGFGPMPELSVFCIQNPKEFKRMVLEAKTRVVSQTNTHLTGQSKTLQVSTDPDVNERLLRVLTLLERQLENQKHI
jgi:hypothetical protein